jgi:hypothetical protein
MPTKRQAHALLAGRRFVPQEALMRVRLAAVAAVLLITTGCARVHHIDPASSSSTFESLNNTAEHRRSTIEFTDGRTRVGDHLRARSDTVSWYDVDRVTGRYAVPTSQIHKISVKERGKGLGRGLLWGLGTGVAVGGTLGSVSSASEISTVVILAAGVCGAVGTGIGAIVGFIVGDKEEYIFEGAERDPSDEAASPPD